MFFLAKNYPTYEAPLTGTAVAPPMKQYMPHAWAGEPGYVFEKKTGETDEGYAKWEKTTLKFFEMMKWLYEYMGTDPETSTPEYYVNGEYVTLGIDKKKDVSIRNFNRKDLLAKTREKGTDNDEQGFRYLNSDGTPVRTSGVGYISPSADTDKNIKDLTDPFGFINQIRRGKNRLPDGTYDNGFVDHAHYQRVLSIGGAQSGIANVRNDSLVQRKADNSDLGVVGLHTSGFENGKQFPLTNFYTQFSDPYEMIPLVHPTDTNFGEEFMMGLFKDSIWGPEKYGSMPLFNRYFDIQSRSSNTRLNLASQFSVDDDSIIYDPLDINFDTQLPKILIDDTISYEADMDEFRDLTENSGGLIVWKEGVTEDQKAANLYGYLAGGTYNYDTYMGTNGKFEKARTSVQTINFAQKMFYSILMISSGIFDLVGGWDYNIGTDAARLEKCESYKDLTDSWSKGNTEKGISDFHMNILSSLTTNIHSVTRAMFSLLDRNSGGDAAHGGYSIINENGDFRSLYDVFTEAKNDLSAVLTAAPPASGSEREKVFDKLTKLNNTLFLDSFGIGHPLVRAPYNKFGSYWGSDIGRKIVKSGFSSGNLSDGSIIYENNPVSNPFYYKAQTSTWNQWYATAYEYMYDSAGSNVWNWVQINRNQKNYARAKSEYKAAQKQTEKMEENERQRDNALADKRRSEAQAANQAADARRRSREAEMRNAGAKNKKKA